MEFHKLYRDEFASLSSYKCQEVSAGIEFVFIVLAMYEKVYFLNFIHSGHYG